MKYVSKKIRFVLPGKVYRLDNAKGHLARPDGVLLRKGCHDAVVVGFKPAKRVAFVKIVTSLEASDKKNKRWFFLSDKLGSIRSGYIIVVPVSELGTRHLSGVVDDPIPVPYDALSFSNTGVKPSSRFLKLLRRKKRPL